MYFKQILDERCGCASYVVASRRTHDAAIIDPALETEPYDALLRERYDTAVVPGRWFEMLDHFRVGFGMSTDDFAEGLNCLGMALDDLA